MNATRYLTSTIGALALAAGFAHPAFANDGDIP